MMKHKRDAEGITSQAEREGSQPTFRFATALVFLSPALLSSVFQQFTAIYIHDTTAASMSIRFTAYHEKDTSAPPNGKAA